MSHKKKVLIILHLCLVFGYLFWVGMQPFIRTTATTKAASLLFDSIKKSPRFQKLEETKQLKILQGAERLKEGSFHPLVTKFRLSLPGLIWALLSLFICFFLLFYIEGAHLVVWALPISVLVYAFSLGNSPSLKGENIFPSENVITEKYIGADEVFKNKKEELVEGWNRYLVHEWSHQEPSEDLAMRTEQLEEAVFNFNMARAEWLLDRRGEDAVVAHLLFHPSFVQLIIYFIWNLLFAWRIHRYTRLEARLHRSSNALA